MYTSINVSTSISQRGWLQLLFLNLSFFNQFMQGPWLGHWNVMIRILRYLKKALGQGLLYEDK